MKKTKPKLMVMVGINKHDKPIFKRVKKIRLQHIDKERIISFIKVKPFFYIGYWYFRAFDRMYVIQKDGIFFDKRYRFYILCCESVKTILEKEKEI